MCQEATDAANSASIAASSGVWSITALELAESAPVCHRPEMPARKKPTKSRRSAFADREIIAKAEGRFAKADKQRIAIASDPKRAVAREQERVRRRPKLKK